MYVSITEAHKMNSSMDFPFLFNWSLSMVFIAVRIKYGVQNNISDTIILVLNLTIFLLVNCEASIVEMLCTAFDVGITKTCRRVTIIITITPKTKLIVVKTLSFLTCKPTAIPTALIRAAEHAIAINANIKVVVNLVLNVA